LIFEGNEVFDCAFTVAELSEQHTSVMAFLARPDLALPVLDLGQYICDTEKCPTFVDGINIYRDPGHLSHQGSRLIGMKNDLLGSALKMANKSQDSESPRSSIAAAK